METTVQPFYIKNNDLLDSTMFNSEFINIGTSIYEVIRIIDGIPLFVDCHLERLRNTAKISHLPFSYSNEELKEKLNILISKNNNAVGNIKIVLNYNKSGVNIYAYYIKHTYPTKEQYSNGVDTILFKAMRDNPNAKIVDNDIRKIINEELIKKDAYEAILVNYEGNLTEGSRSNLFFVKDNNIYTSPKELVLPGITRNIIINIAKNCRYNVIEKIIHVNNINIYDAVFLTGTSPKVLPVRSIDNRYFNSPSNSIIKRLIFEYDNIIKNYLEYNRAV